MRITLCINILITKIYVTQETKNNCHFLVNIVPLNKRNNVNRNMTTATVSSFRYISPCSLCSYDKYKNKDPHIRLHQSLHS